jgi:hypothetical protein
MCGIAGVVGRATDEKLVPRMIEIMKHRGPDLQGFYRSENIHLGHYLRLFVEPNSHICRYVIVAAAKSRNRGKGISISIEF